MPLTEQGKIMVSHHQREEDKKFLARYGHEKLQEKLDREGVYAYGFADKDAHDKAVDVIFELSEECRWRDDAELKKYAARFEYKRSFDFEFWRSSIAESSEVLVIEKPFPKARYDQRLRLLELSFREVPVYRLADLTEEQIINFRGGVLWHSYCYIDLNETIKQP